MDKHSTRKVKSVYSTLYYYSALYAFLENGKISALYRYLALYAFLQYPDFSTLYTYSALYYYLALKSSFYTFGYMEGNPFVICIYPASSMRNI